MLVILMDNQIITSQQVCQGCLLADQRGQPRWRGGQLCCGHLVQPSMGNQPSQYECQMGFRIANVE